jgi:hypothetical protein
VIKSITVTGGTPSATYNVKDYTPGNSALNNDGTQYNINWQTKNPPFTVGSWTITLTLDSGQVLQKSINLSTSGGASGLVIDTATGTASAGALLARDLTLYVDNSSGNFTADELARIQSAIASVDALVAPYGAEIDQVDGSVGTAANIVIDANTTTVVGGYADGVLGCTTQAGEVTIVQGWNWYAGTDATAVGSNQYDFTTVVTHELGHAIGLGHSTDATSVMYPELATGAARRTMVVADLNIADADGGNGCGLHAQVIRPVLVAAPSAPTVNQNPAVMVWDLALTDPILTSFTRAQGKRK